MRSQSNTGCRFSSAVSPRDETRWKRAVTKVRTVKPTTDVKRSMQTLKAFGGASWLAMWEAEGLYKPTESTRRGAPTALAGRGVGPGKPCQEARCRSVAEVV